jgi:uncharacterized protein with gpF-like domain
VLKARPYWQVMGVGDARQRDNHRAVMNWVIRADDAIWKTVHPPFGYQCRCRLRSLSEQLVQKLGLQVRHGSEVRDLPDKGFESGIGSLL